MLVAHFLLGRDGEGCGVGDVLTYTNPNPEIGTTSSFFFIFILNIVLCLLKLWDKALLFHGDGTNM